MMLFVCVHNRFSEFGYTNSGECRWRQTGNCDPNGPREWEHDLLCSQIVDTGASGYCQCSEGLIKGILHFAISGWFIK